VARVLMWSWILVIWRSLCRFSLRMNHNGATSIYNHIYIYANNIIILYDLLLYVIVIILQRDDNKLVPMMYTHNVYKVYIYSYSKSADGVGYIYSSEGVAFYGSHRKAGRPWSGHSWCAARFRGGFDVRPPPPTYIYIYRQRGMIVIKCHKLPATTERCVGITTVLSFFLPSLLNSRSSSIIKIPIPRCTDKPRASSCLHNVIICVWPTDLDGIFVYLKCEFKLQRTACYYYYY